MSTLNKLKIKIKKQTLTSTISYKVHSARWAKKATHKNSKNFRKVSAFSFEKVSIR